MDIRYATCTFCDGGCTIRGEIDPTTDTLRVSPANPDHPAICSKASMIDEYRLHPDRLTHPLQRQGARGSGQWERISWNEALDEIAAKLRAITDEHGPEAIAFAEMPLNHGFGGIT